MQKEIMDMMEDKSRENNQLRHQLKEQSEQHHLAIQDKVLPKVKTTFSEK